MSSTLLKVRSSQRTAHNGHGVLPLPVSGAILSPYFQTEAFSREKEPGRNILNILETMKAIMMNHEVAGTNCNFAALFTDAGETAVTSSAFFGFTPTTPFTHDNIVAMGVQATIDYAATQGWTLTASDVIDYSIVKAPVALANAPQAAIANAPADAVTNYNIVTTLLGTLTSAVNTANTKQNEIATKLNSLLAELRTLGLITP